jgi:hypothetical protein
MYNNAEDAADAVLQELLKRGIKLTVQKDGDISYQIPGRSHSGLINKSGLQRFGMRQMQLKESQQKSALQTIIQALLGGDGGPGSGPIVGARQ